MKTQTVKLCFELRGVYYCPKCKALYYTKVECSCPNLDNRKVYKE